MNKTLALCPPLIFTALLLSACKQEKIDPEPNYEEGKTLARHGALMMQSLQGNLSDNTRVFLGSNAQKVATFSSDVESILGDEAFAQTVFAAFLSTVPIYRLDAEARIYAEEFLAGNITLLDLIPTGEFTDPATNLSVTFQAEENNGSYEITIDLQGEFDACTLNGGSPEYCTTQIDMSFVLRESGLRYDRTEASDTESYIIGKETLNLSFSGSIENTGYKLDIQNGTFEIHGDPLTPFEYEFTPRNSPSEDSFAMSFPATELSFDASFTAVEDRAISKINFPMNVKFNRWQFESSSGFEEGDTDSFEGAHIENFAMQGLNISLGRIDFTHTNGSNAWLNINFSSDFETPEAWTSYFTPCTNYPECFSRIVGSTIELFYLGSEEIPALDLEFDYGFEIDGQILNAGNHYLRDTEFNNQWTVTSEYDNQSYTGVIQKGSWFENTALEITNGSGARIFATTTEGSFTGQIVDSNGLTLGSVETLDDTVIAVFNDGSNITLEAR